MASRDMIAATGCHLVGGRSGGQRVFGMNEGDILQAIMDGTHAQLAYLDAQFNFVLVNVAYVRGSGRRKEELIGRNHFDLFPNAENQAVFERARDRGEEVEFFARPFAYADQPEAGGTYRNWTCVPVKDAAGHVQGLVLSLLDVTEAVSSQKADPAREGLSVYLRDVTERKREEELNARLAAIVESSEDAIIGLTHEGSISSWNPGAERLFGYSAEEVNGRSVSILYPPDHPDEFPQLVKRLERGERVEHYETQRVRKDGKRIEVALSISPIKDSDGRIIGAAKIASDITAQRRAREAEHFLVEASAVLASSLDYEATLQSVARLALPFLADYCVVELVEPDGSLRRVAVAAASPQREQRLIDLMARYPPGADAMAVGRVLQSGLPHVMWEMPDSSFDSVAQDPELVQILRELDPKSFMVVPMIARGRTLGTISLGLAAPSRRYDAADLTVAEDLARRAAYAVDIARLYFESQAAVTARDQFLSLASHELRTPLTVIQGYTQLLRQQAKQFQAGPDSMGTLDQAKLLRGLRNIEYSAARLEALMSDLMDITRLPGGTLAVSPERMDLSELLLSVVESVRTQKELLPRSNRPDVRVEISDREIWGEWDRGRLDQVLTNLVDNALKYSPAGGVVQINLALENAWGQLAGPCAHLVVRDEGIGIPPAELGRIFQPFVRATNAVERQYPGLGIGLAVSKEIVNRHGGRIWAESKGVDQGTTFHVVLPVRES